MFKLIPHIHEEFTPTEKYLPHFITNGLFVVVDDIHTDRVLRTDLFSDIFFLTNDATTDRVLHPGSLFGIFSLMNDKCKRRFFYLLHILTVEV